MVIEILSILVISFWFVQDSHEQLWLPIRTMDRHSIAQMELTAIGKFGLWRRERKGVPAHFHTGIDIKRPNGNYQDELIYPIARGKIISKRTDGPYAQLIIEHIIDGEKVWTLYEHIAGINVSVNDIVSPDLSIARFMNKDELHRYGWQFDHFHFEVIKVNLIKIKPTASYPERFYSSYSLICYSKVELEKYFNEPLEFFGEHWKQRE